jgi:hypothetical protein
MGFFLQCCEPALASIQIRIQLFISHLRRYKSLFERLEITGLFVNFDQEVPDSHSQYESGESMRISAVPDPDPLFCVFCGWNVWYCTGGSRDWDILGRDVLCLGHFVMSLFKR